MDTVLLYGVTRAVGGSVWQVRQWFRCMWTIQEMSDSCIILSNGDVGQAVKYACFDMSKNHINIVLRVNHARSMSLFNTQQLMEGLVMEIRKSGRHSWMMGQHMNEFVIHGHPQQDFIKARETLAEQLQIPLQHLMQCHQHFVMGGQPCCNLHSADVLHSEFLDGSRQLDVEKLCGLRMENTYVDRTHHVWQIYHHHPTDRDESLSESGLRNISGATVTHTSSNKSNNGVHTFVKLLRPYVWTNTWIHVCGNNPRLLLTYNDNVLVFVPYNVPSLITCKERWRKKQ